MYSLYRCYEHARTCIQSQIPTFQEACQTGLVNQQRNAVANAQFLIYGPSIRSKTQGMYWFRFDATSSGIQISVSEQYSVLLHKSTIDSMYHVTRQYRDEASIAWTGIATRKEADYVANWLRENDSREQVRYIVDKSQTRASRAFSEAYRLPQTHSGEYQVVRIEDYKTKVVKKGFRSADAARNYAHALQRMNSEKTVTYDVKYYTSSMPKRRKKKSSLPYRSYELLGLGIPAQTGHGRRSRKWFNDPT